MQHARQMWPFLFIFMFFGMKVSAQPPPPIVIDGNNSDWENVGSNRWFDELGDAGGGPRDITKFKLVSDGASLFIYIEFAQVYGNPDYPIVKFYLDRDGKFKTGLGGYEALLTITGAHSGTSTAGSVSLTRYLDNGTVDNTTLFPPFSPAWKPNGPSHNLNFIELSVPLSNLGLQPAASFRFFVRSLNVSPYPNGDWIGDEADSLSSILRYYPPNFPFAIKRPIQIDGINTDWRLLHNGVYDSISDGSGDATRDLVMTKMSSDATYLYFYAQMQKPYGLGSYPEIHLLLDTDLDSTTGKDGAEAEILLGGASSSGPCPGGCIGRNRFDSQGNSVSGGISYNNWPRKPDYPGHGLDFIEAALPLSDFGLTPGRRIRYYAWSNRFNGTKDYLHEMKSIGSSTLHYTLGREMAVDQVEDDWVGVETSWLDPIEDSVGGYCLKNYSTRDLTGLALYEDSTNLYGKIVMASGFSQGDYPEVTIFIDSDRNSSTGQAGYDLSLMVVGPSINSPCAGGCIQKSTYASGNATGSSYLPTFEMMPRSRSHTSDLIEFSIPLDSLGLQAGKSFRFVARSRFNFAANPPVYDYLQGNTTIANSTLFFGGPTVNLGVHSGTNSDTVIHIKDALMPGPLALAPKAFIAGKYFNVQLSIHGEDLKLGDGYLDPATNHFVYNPGNIQDFQAEMKFIGSQGMTFAPEISFKIVPGWFDLMSNQPNPHLVNSIGVVDSTTFLRRIPYCYGFKTWGRDLAITIAETTKPYLGDVISSLAIGNETFYDNTNSLKDLGYDNTYTLPKWQLEYPGQPFPNPANVAFMEFRSRMLVDSSLIPWVTWPFLQLQRRLPVATKAVPFNLAGDLHNLQNSGYFPHLFDYINSRENLLTGADIYGWGKNDRQSLYRLDKPMAFYEFGAHALNTPTTPDSVSITDWIVDGVTKYKLRSAYEYTWDPGDPNSMFSVQKAGVRMAIREVAKADPPPARLYSVRIQLPANYIILDNGVDGVSRVAGLQKIATLVQAQFPQIGAEIDNDYNASGADLNVKVISSSMQIPEEDVYSKSNIYLLYGKRTRVNFGSHYVTTDSTLTALTYLISKLASDLFTVPLNALLANNETSQVTIGNHYLTTNVPSTGSGAYLPLAFASGYLTIMKVGKSVFVSPDMAARSAGSEMEPSHFMAELIKKLIYGEI